MYGQHFQQGMNQPGVVASPARGHLKKKKITCFLSSFAPENVVLRDRFGGPVPHQPDAHSLYSRLIVVLTYGISPCKFLFFAYSTTCFVEQTATAVESRAYVRGSRAMLHTQTLCRRHHSLLLHFVLLMLLLHLRCTVGCFLWHRQFIFSSQSSAVTFSVPAAINWRH